MTLNDPLANALSLMVNNEVIGKQECIVKPISFIIKEVIRVFKEAGYIEESEEVEDGKGKYLKVKLTGNINKCGVVKPRYSTKISDIEKFEKRLLPAKGVGILVISTPQGIMNHDDAKKKKVGGKLLAYCY